MCAARAAAQGREWKAWVRAFPNLGRYGAARRAARAVFLASAPRTGSANRGVEIQRVKLACTLPGESVATYGDALNRLTDRSSYLYVEGARYWYGTQASVARRARELVEQLLSTRRDEVHGEIVRRLRDQGRERGEFVAVHVCPVSAGEIPDDPEARLVILGPSAPHTSRDASSLAMTAAHAILEQRASGQRLYRNMLVFLAPDLKRLAAKPSLRRCTSAAICCLACSPLRNRCVRRDSGRLWPTSRPLHMRRNSPPSALRFTPRPGGLPSRVSLRHDEP